MKHVALSETCGTYRQEACAVLTVYPALAAFRKKQLRKLWLKILLSSLLILGLTGYLYYETNQIALAVMGVALFAFSLYKTANPRRNFSRRCGVVREAAPTAKRVNNKNGFTFGYTAMMDAVVLVVLLEASNGRMHRMELGGQFESTIRKGDILLRLPGVPYPVTKTPGDIVICPYCGTIMPRENADCVGCGEGNIYR